MRKFKDGDYVQIVPHLRLPNRLNIYRLSTRVEHIEVIGLYDREYRIKIFFLDGSSRTDWALPYFLEKASPPEEDLFEEELLALYYK